MIQATGSQPEERWLHLGSCPPVNLMFLCYLRSPNRFRAGPAIASDGYEDKNRKKMRGDAQALARRKVFHIICRESVLSITKDLRTPLREHRQKSHPPEVPPLTVSETSGVIVGLVTSRSDYNEGLT